MKRPLLFLSAIAFAIVSLSSCGGSDKKDDPTPEGKTAKITVSFTGMEADDDILFQAHAGRADNTTTFWKLDGVTQNNQSHMALDEDHATQGKAYVYETVLPVQILQVSLSGQNFNGPFTANVKVEVDGKVVMDLHENITTTFNKDWSY